MDLNVGKSISLVVFFLVTMVLGTSVVLLFSQCQKRLTSRSGKTVLTLLKCFAGGVFLSTCLLGLLTEGLEEYEEFKEVAGFTGFYPFFNLGIGAGFFLVAYMERLAFCFSRGILQNEERVREMDDARAEPLRRSKRTDEETSKAETGSETETVIDDCMHADLVFSLKDVAQNPAPNALPHTAVSKRHDADHSSDGEESTPAPATSGVRAVIFLLALSFHTLFDGLAVGLQDSETDVWAMTVAITIHKAIMAISLALELSLALPGRPVKIILLLFLFSLMTPIGVAIGMGMTSGHVNIRAQLLAGSILQALASGSVLYVTFYEILGEELGHHGNVTKVSVTVLGFAAIAVAKIWDTD